MAWNTKIIRVHFWDKNLRKDFYQVLSIVSLVFALVFITPVENLIQELVGEMEIWKYFLVFYLLFLVLSYLILWVRANRRKSISIKGTDYRLEVRSGDLFLEPQQVWKAIGVNEYFDTVTGGKMPLVSEQSLHGKYLNRFYQDGVRDLDRRMKAELKGTKGKKKNKRKAGKRMGYPLGTIFCDKENDRRYLLTALARTDSYNRAYLTMKDYVNFLLKFWEEVDKFYDGTSVSVPLFGSGLVRFRNENMTPQELLELMIWTLQKSHLKMAYGTKISILLYGDIIEEINLYQLKKMFTGLPKTG